MGRACLIVVVVGWAGAALACSLGVPSGRAEVPDPLDEAPPGQVRDVAIEVRRGEERREDRFGCDEDDDEASSGLGADCSGAASIRLDITPPADDRTPPEQMAYLVRQTGGAMPEGLEIPTFPMTAPVRLMWGDGWSAAQEPIDLYVRITAVDATGREGEPSAPIRIHDPGRSGDDGCAATSAHHAPLWALALLGLAWRTRRRPAPSNAGRKRAQGQAASQCERQVHWPSSST